MSGDSENNCWRAWQARDPCRGKATDGSVWARLKNSKEAFWPEQSEPGRNGKMSKRQVETNHVGPQSPW